MRATGPGVDIALPEAENKVWHAHTVWFLDGNPVVGYSKLKAAFAYSSGAASRLRHLASVRRVSSRQLKHASRPLIKSTRWPCEAGLLSAAKCSGTTRTLFAAKASWNA
jgi:hypothetical protein